MRLSQHTRSGPAAFLGMALAVLLSGAGHGATVDSPGSLEKNGSAGDKSAVEPGSPSLEGFDDFVDRVRSEWQIPGMGVAIVQNGVVLFSGGFGFRDAERRLPVTTRTIFPLGSNTKPFTAVALAMLVDDGAIELDEPLVNAVPGFRLHDEQATSQATIRDLLSHRTGLPSQYDMMWLLTPISRTDLFARLRYLEPNARLRERFQYSNVGYAAAGTILERICGMTWEEFLAERIFEPLGMSRSGFVEPTEASEEDRALPYRHASGRTSRVAFSGSVVFENVSLIGPAGSVSSTLEDMTKWLTMLLEDGRVNGGELVAKTSLQELFSRQMEIVDPGYRMLMQADAYGLGWAITEYRGHRVINHGGNIEGFSSLVSFMPRLDAGVVVLSNTMNIAGYALSRNVYDRLLGLEPMEWNEELRKLSAMVEQSLEQASHPPPSDPAAPPPLPLESYAGSYRHPAFGSVGITESNASLTIHFESNLKAALHHVSSDRFKGTTGEFYLPSFEVRFPLSEDNAVKGFTLILQPGAPEIQFSKIGLRGASAGQY